MKCQKCGFENTEETSYCMNCGTRLDGKIMCPNCRSLVEPHEDNCPSCGAKLPKEITVKDTKEYNDFKAARERRNRVWQIVFTAIFVALLAYSLIGVFGPMITATDWVQNTFAKGSGLYYLTFEFGRAFSNLKSTTDAIGRFNILFKPIFRFIVCLANVTVTYSFGVIGILKGIKQLRMKRECKFTLHYYVAAILASYVITSSCLLSSYSSDLSNTVSLVGSFKSEITTFILSVFVGMVYHVYYRYDNRKRALFIQNIIFSLGFVLCVFTLLSLEKPLITVLGNDTKMLVSEFDIFRQFMSNVVHKVGSPTLSTILSSTSGIAIVLTLLIRVVATIYIIFFVKGFFLYSEEEIKVKLPCYFGSIVIFILSSILLLVSISICITYKAYLLGYSFNTNIFAIIKNVALDRSVIVSCNGADTAAFLSFLMVGTSMSSFMIVKKYRKNMKIIDARKASLNK